jgi:hypothetical protein
MANSIYDVQFTVSFKLMDNSTSGSLSTDYRLKFVIPKIFTGSSQALVSKSNKTSIVGQPYLKYITLSNNGEAFVYFSEMITPVTNLTSINKT